MNLYRSVSSCRNCQLQEIVECNERCREIDENIQGVHKHPLQFQKFVTKAIDEISLSDLFHVLGDYQGFYQIAFQVPC